MRAGEPVKMSKRSGDFVTLREVVEEVGRDPVRFMMLYRKNDAPLDFDFQKVTEQSKDNPVFYVQYAHARTCSIFRQAATEMPGRALDPAALAQAPLEKLVDAGELALIRRLAEYPRVIEAAAEAHEPHSVAFYLHELASELHGHWNRGKELPQLRFINSERLGIDVGATGAGPCRKIGVGVGIGYSRRQRTRGNAVRGGLQPGRGTVGMTDRSDPLAQSWPGGDRRPAETRRSPSREDDPLAELAKAVQGRSGANALNGRGHAEPPKVSNGVQDDLEAELMNDLQASFAAVHAMAMAPKSVPTAGSTARQRRCRRPAPAPQAAQPRVVVHSEPLPERAPAPVQSSTLSL